MPDSLAHSSSKMQKTFSCSMHSDEKILENPDTVDARNPAPVDMANIPFYVPGFCLGSTVRIYVLMGIIISQILHFPTWLLLSSVFQNFPHALHCSPFPQNRTAVSRSLHLKIAWQPGVCFFSTIHPCPSLHRVGHLVQGQLKPWESKSPPLLMPSSQKGLWHPRSWTFSPLKGVSYWVPVTFQGLLLLNFGRVSHTMTL